MKLFQLCVLASTTFGLQAVPLHDHDEIYSTTTFKNDYSSSPKPHYDHQQQPQQTTKEGYGYDKPYYRNEELRPRYSTKLDKFDHITDKIGDLVTKLMYYHHKVKKEERREERREEEEEDEPSLLEVLLENPRIVHKIKTGRVTIHDVENIANTENYDSKNKEYSVKKNGYDNYSPKFSDKPYPKHDLENYQPQSSYSEIINKTSNPSESVVELPNKREGKSIHIWKIRPNYHPSSSQQYIKRASSFSSLMDDSSKECSQET